MRRCFSILLPALLAAGCGQGADDAADDAKDADAVQAAPEPAAAAVDEGGSAVQTLTQQLLLVDTHIDVPYRLHDEWEDVSQATADGDFDYPRAVAGGLDAMFMSIYIPADVDARGEATDFANALIDSVEKIVTTAPDKFAIATCAADIEQIKANGMIAMPLGMENGGPIAGNFDTLAEFRDRGIRYVTLAHSKSNHISDSSYDLNEQWQGLSDFGKKLIPVMNRQGVMVDVSHVSDRAFWQILELTETPIIASHSSLRHFLTAAARDYANASQQAFLRFRAEQQLAPDDPRLKEFVSRYREENPYPYATLDDVLDHIDRAVELAGIDHVGIGSDYDGVGDSLPVDLKDVSQYPNLTAGLQARGYSTEDIGKILGGNLMRIWREVEAYAEAAGTATQCAIAAG
jgi:membrane dipeptidase